MPFSKYKRAEASFVAIYFILSDSLNLSRTCPVVRIDVASVRIDNRNMAFTVNFAWADQSFAIVCLPVLEGRCIPVLRLSLHTQTAMLRDEFS